jgi:hypothetical protein
MDGEQTMKKGTEEHALGGRGSRLHRSRAGADPEEAADRIKTNDEMR